MTESNSSRFDENERKRILNAYPHHRNADSEKLDALAQLAARLCDAPVGLVSLVDHGKQVFVGRSGTDLSATAHEHSLCAIAMHADAPFIVHDTAQDPRLASAPLTAEIPKIRFYAGYPLRSPEGAPLGTLCVIDDKPRDGLTGQQLDALSALADAVMAMLGQRRSESESAREQARSDSSLREMQQRFELLANNIPQLVWSTDADGMGDYFNRGWCEYTGQPASESLGTRRMSFLHPDDWSATNEAWRTALKAQSPYEVEYRLRDSHGTYRWMLARGRTSTDRDGNVVRWVGTCTDIDQHHRAVERESTLSRELDHRIKNIFAVISGLISLSIRETPELAPVGEDLRDRILALGRAHDLVRISSSSGRTAATTTLQALLHGLLLPYRREDGNRIHIEGADCAIDDRSATPLALFFHELATNATKHGALSVPEGQIRVAISYDPETGLDVHWTESGGPAVAPGAHAGFGERLIDLTIARQLGGTVSYDWRPEGLAICAHIPAMSLVR